MSKRNIQKCTDQGMDLIWNHHRRDDLSMTETVELLNMANEGDTNGLIEVIMAAYYMGYFTGHKRGAKTAKQI